MSKALIIQTPGAMTGSGGKKLENYVGIEFTRGASDGGGEHGYHKMIGDEELLSELPLFNQIKLAMVRDAKIITYLNQTNINKSESGADVDLAGADGSDVMQCYPDMYCIIGGTDATYERFIFSDEYFEYGDDKAFKWNAFAQAPDREVIVAGAARSIYSNNPGSFSVSKATDVSDGSWANGNGYPSALKKRYEFEAAAKARNANASSNKPYMNGTTLDLEIILGVLYVEMRTKNFCSVFGYGLSSAVTPTAENWNTTTGVKTTVDGVELYFPLSRYIYINGIMYNFFSAIGNISLHKILEPQKLASDGATLIPVYNSDGEALQNTNNGVMTGILKKTITFKLTCALEKGETEAEHSFELNLMIPIWRGATWMAGNIFSSLSGYDVVNYVDDNGTTHNILYRAKDIASIVTDSDYDDRTSKFDFESIYEEVCDLGYQTGWMKTEVAKNGVSLALAKDFGAGADNYQSAYLQLSKSSSGKRERHTAGFFGSVCYSSLVSLRYALVAKAASYNIFTSSRFRCELQ